MVFLKKVLVQRVLGKREPHSPKHIIDLLDLRVSQSLCVGLSKT